MHHSTLAALSGAAADSWLENVTVVGEGTYKADKGGAIEMSGGTVTNCVVRDGTAYGNDSRNAGGNLLLAGTPAQLFKNYAKGDFTPTAGGLLYDRGTAPLIAASVDLAGRPRVQFLRIDVGCYECPFQPATIIVVR